MKKYISLLAILLISSAGLYAQSIYNLRSAIDFFETNKIMYGDSRHILSESEVEGSPYYIDEFKKGTIYTYQKIQYNDIPLRYNIYKDEMEFQKPDDQILAIATPEIVEKAVVGEDTFSNIPYEFGNTVKHAYFILLIEGKLSLYMRPEIIYQKPKKAAGYIDPEPAKFIKRPDVFYLRINQQAAVKIESKKDLQNFFTDHQKQIQDFIKKNKIKVGKKDKIIELVQYYNSL